MAHGAGLAGLVEGYTLANAWGAGVLAVGGIVIFILVDTHLGRDLAE